MLAHRGGDVEFVALFGSRARGNWTERSDFDVLIDLSTDDGQRRIDRIGEFSALTTENIDVFPYARSEWERMFAGRHLLFLEALDHGKVLYDRGAFGRMRQVFAERRRTGQVRPFGRGWKIGPQPPAASTERRPG
jgi:predicted nucleotidyltransferase